MSKISDEAVKHVCTQTNKHEEYEVNPLLVRFVMLSYHAYLEQNGLVIVPKEPTPKMWATAADELVNNPNTRERLPCHHDMLTAIVWRKMITAYEKECARSEA